MNHRTYLNRVTMLAFVLWIGLVGPPAHGQRTLQQQFALNRQLMDALTQDKQQVPLTLINQGADPNTWYKTTLLSSRHRRIEPLPPPSNYGTTTALMLACGPYLPDAYVNPGLVQQPSENAKQALQLVEAMLRKGADVNAHNNEGWTPLMFAALFNRPDTVRLLLAHGAEVNVKSKAGMTPLMAASGLAPTVVALLLSHGAEVNVQDKNGVTAIFLAAQELQPAIMRDTRPENVVGQLLTHGADPNLADKHGDTPLRLAQHAGRDDIVALLKQYGAKK